MALFSRPHGVPAGATSAETKIPGSWVGGSTRRGAAESGSRSGRWCRSGGGLQGDGVAEGFELADVVALGALGVDAGVVEASTEVVVAQVGVGQQVPDDDQDGAADRDDGAVLAAASGDASVALAQEGVGPPSGHGGLPEDPGQVAVAVAGGVLAFSLAGGLLIPGTNLAQEVRWPGVGKRPMS